MKYLHLILEKFRFLACAAIVFFGVGEMPTAFAAEHIVERAYRTDDTGLASFEQVKAQPYTPYEGVLSLGYTASAVWLRLRVVPPQGSDPDERLILRILPVFLDEIRLYDPLDTSGRTRLAGDQINYRNEEYRSLTHTFVIPAGSEPRYVWLRVKTTSTSLINPELLTQQEMLEGEHRQLIEYFAALSLIAIFLIVVFINWLNSPEFLYLVFMGRNLVFLIHASSYFGFLRLLMDGWIDAKYLDLGNNWLVVGATAVSIYFEIIFLSEYLLSQSAKMLLRVLMAISACVIALLALGEVQWALRINMALNGLSVLTFLLVAIVFINGKSDKQAEHSKLLRKRWLVAYYASIAVLLMLNVTPQLIAWGGGDFYVNGFFFYPLYAGVIMTVLLQVRSNQLRKINMQYAQDLVLSAQQVTLEKKRREEQSQLLTMLMHELKTPLSVIDLAQQGTTDLEAKGYVARNVTIIKKILDRCLNADRIAIGQLEVNFQPVHVRKLLQLLITEHTAGRFELVWNIPALELVIQTDYQCLHIILNNLLDNAIRYGDQAQPIVINVQACPNGEGAAGLTIAVVNKTGIASWPDPDMVFKKYYRSAGAKMISGTGLGLFLVSSISRIIGARCFYRPDETHVRFELWLPT